MKTFTFFDVVKTVSEIVPGSSVSKEWSISLPFNTPPSQLQALFSSFRNEQLCGWHIVFGNPTEEIPEPKTSLYWDKS